MFSSPNTSAVMGSVTPDRLGTASASTTTARQIGQSIGIAIATAIFSAQAAAFALARSPLGLDDLAIKPAALTSGLELALIVAASITALGILTSVSRGRLPAAEPSELAPCTVASPWDGAGGNAAGSRSGTIEARTGVAQGSGRAD